MSTTRKDSSTSNPAAPTATETIETIFFRATSPSQKTVDPNLLNSFCSRVNSEPEGHLTAIRLIAHKIQSPQEDEALRTLELLDVCVLSCGRRFHQEIGKFRFLNEMIKLVSPKYLGNHTSDKVKKKVIETLFSWTKRLSSEVKISEAYQMLKRQSIIIEDPVFVDQTSSKSMFSQRSKSIFDDDPEKKKTLERLLKSRRPEDLEQANALIRSFVKQDEEKIEKLSHRAQELEKIHNNIRVLSDMLIEFNPSTVSEAEKETMNFLHDELEKFRPILFRLASETDEDDQGLGEILSTSDALGKVLTQYDRLVRRDDCPSTRDDKMVCLLDELELVPATRETKTADLLGNVDQSTETSIEKELNDLFGSIDVSASSQVVRHETTNPEPVDKKNKDKPLCIFDDLKEFLVDPSTGKSLSSISHSNSSSFEENPSKMPLNQLKSLSERSRTDEKPKSKEGFPEIRLEEIRPSVKHQSIPLNLNKKNIECLLFIARESPRPDLIPMVLSAKNMNTEFAVKSFRFRAFVGKNVEIKLEEATLSELPAYNPMVSNPSISQLVVLWNRGEENIELAFRIEYLINGEQVNESGFVDRGIPSCIVAD